MPVYISWYSIVWIAIFTAVVHSWITTPRRGSSLHPLSSMQMKEVLIERQARFDGYEQRIMEALPPNVTVVRWYISRFIEDRALVEAVVVEPHQPHPHSDR